jgi:DNA-binding NarL/FixJ family response regulator
MRYNNAIIATNADFLADILRDTLRDFNAGPVQTVRNENELMSGIKNGCPRFVFLENCFRDGVTEEYVRRLTRRYRDIRVVVWSVSEVKPPRAAGYIYAGADSYFTLRDRDEQVRAVLGRILSGKHYYPAEVGKILERVDYIPRTGKDLTMREAEVAKLSITGKSRREIAAVLGVKPSTVKMHKLNIYRKCGGNRPVDILRYGLAKGGYLFGRFREHLRALPGV